jgi:hypothetical protein
MKWEYDHEWYMRKSFEGVDRGLFEVLSGQPHGRTEENYESSKRIAYNPSDIQTSYLLNKIQRTPAETGLVLIKLLQLSSPERMEV